MTALGVRWHPPLASGVRWLWICELLTPRDEYPIAYLPIHATRCFAVSRRSRGQWLRQSAHILPVSVTITVPVPVAVSGAGSP
jgi:hypothetical protein